MLFQGLDDPVMKSTAVDIFSYVVEFNPSMVRDFILHEGQKQDDVRGFAVLFIFSMISLLCRLFASGFCLRYMLFLN